MTGQLEEFGYLRKTCPNRKMTRKIAIVETKAQKDLERFRCKPEAFLALLDVLDSVGIRPIGFREAERRQPASLWDPLRR